MKKNIIYVLAAIAALTSCSKLEDKLLEVDVIGKNTIEGFMTEYDGYTAAAEGLHAEIRSFYTVFLKYGEVAGDLLDSTINADEGDLLLFNYELQPSHIATYPRTYWNAGWSIVTQVTYILEYGPKVMEKYTSPSEVANVKKIMAQAHFARALAMHALCSAYAMPYNYTPDHSHIGIPILTQVAAFDDVLPRQSVGAVYSQILGDLGEALSLMDEAGAVAQKDAITDCYHISYIACEALMARVALYMEDWENAAKYSASVMGKVRLTPREGYVAMFRSSTDNPGVESILRLNTFGQTSSMSNYYDPTKSAKFQPTTDMYKNFDSDDIRASLLTYVPEDGEEGVLPGSTFKAVCKYLYYKSIVNEDKRVHDPFVFRASEMYLIHAEAVLQASGDVSSASDDVKALIARARGVEASSISLPSDKDGMLAAVAKERVRELCYEGHRKFDIVRRGDDLVRTNNAKPEALTIKYPDYRFILPIDKTEMQANELMVQNEGYPTTD